jgi:Kef-type K+ transport system membrane component KefB
MAQVVALVLLIIIGLRFGPGLLRRIPSTQKSVAIAGALALILALIALAQATHLEQPLNRWHSVSEQIPADAR